MAIPSWRTCVPCILMRNSESSCNLFREALPGPFLAWCQNESLRSAGAVAVGGMFVRACACSCMFVRACACSCVIAVLVVVRVHVRVSRSFYDDTRV